MRSRYHRERHAGHRIGWLRAAVLGANDGIISTSSLLVGVASGSASQAVILVTGVAGLVAGAMSMAAGEFVSVSSQADLELSDLEREKAELASNTDAETQELAEIYVQRGLGRDLAREVAKQLMVHDALGSHARDELGITDLSLARPFQAALASAGSFTLGALLPVTVAAVASRSQLSFSIAGAALVFLPLLGFVAAKAGRAKILPSVLRVLFWGAISMVVTAVIGRWVGSAL